MASKQKCKFGEKCYRKNPQHKKDYWHPNKKEDDDGDEPAPKKPKKEAKKESPKAVNKIEDYFGKKKKEESNDEEADDIKPGTSSSDVEEEKEADIEESDDDFEADFSPEDVKESIKRKFLVEMPEDFYHLWEFCEKKNSKCPTDALDIVGLKLVGPYDILANNHKGITKNSRGKRPNFLLHWRYYYDPPEFTTVIKGDDKTQFHIGYFRDDPEELPALVASNSAAEGGLLVPKGDNLFSAVKWCIEDNIRNKSPSDGRKKKLENLLEDITSYAESKNHCLLLKSKKMKDRDKKIVTKGLHNAGIVVPIDENEIGYRELPETLAARKKMYKAVLDAAESEKDKKMDPIQEMVTLVQFANDECDYGEGLELGIDMFCYGGDVFHPMISHLLPLAYQLLGRMEFKQIIEAHLKRRRRGSELSELK